MARLNLTPERALLALIMALAGLLSFYGVGKEGFANEYYAAAVKSMLESFHNFFFVSFDPGGFVSVDKPPLGLWIQALSAAIFGFQGWSLILPQAAATVLSTALIYHLVGRTFGKPAGLIASLVFALTPIVAAVSRTNNLDPILVLFLLLAAWAVILASERGSLKLLLAGMCLVGLGFNVKMVQAFGVVPALLLIYLLSPAISKVTKVKHLAIALVLLLAVSFSWATIVDLTPADQRPYVGSSQTNSVLELILGYNGLQRIVPGGSAMGMSMPSGNHSGGMSGTLPDDNSTISRMLDFRGMGNVTGGMTPPSGGMGGFGGEGGSSGIFRLFNVQMAGQISWLLPLAIFGFFAAFLIVRRRNDSMAGARLRNLCFWGAWLLPMMAYFSIAGFFHRYYLITMAPAIAALCGISLATMWSAYKAGGWKAYLLPLALVITALVQGFILCRYPDLDIWIVPIVCAVSLTAAFVLAFGKADVSGLLRRAVLPLAVLGFAALLIAPAFWSITPIIYHSETMIPYAGPELATGGTFGGGSGFGLSNASAGMPGMGVSVDQGLVQFLLNNTEDNKYLVAVPNAMSAESIILETGRPVMAIGGFLGSDPILTVDRLEQMVADDEVRYFLVNGMSGLFGLQAANRSGNETIGGGQGGMPGGMMDDDQSVMEWVETHGSLIPSSDWSDEADSNATGGMGFGGIGGMQLYDLQGGT